jgi:prepilin-type processing-associated H-X9-DG protein
LEAILPDGETVFGKELAMILRKAFTLIELLLVIATIVILGLLLYPVTIRMREKGRQIQCVSNLKQLHTAAMNYAATRGRMPYSTTYQEFDLSSEQWILREGWVSWRTNVALGNTGVRGNIDMVEGGGYRGLACISNGTLFPFIGDVRVYLCPTWAMLARQRLGTASAIRPVRSYVMNDGLNNVSLYGLTTGSKQILFGEAGIQRIWEGKTYATYAVLTDAGTAPWATWTLVTNRWRIYPDFLTGDGALMVGAAAGGTNESLAPIHAAGQTHAVFADGHVEMIPMHRIKEACYGTF